MSRKNISVEYKVLNAEFRKKMKEIRSDVTTLNKEFRLQQEQMRNSATFSEKLRSEIDNLGKRLEFSKEKTEAIKVAMEGTKNTLGENSVEYQRLNNQLLDSQREEERLKNAIESKTQKLEQALEQEKKYTEEFKKNQQASEERKAKLKELEESQDLVKSSSEKLTAQYELEKAKLGENASESEKLKLKQEYLAEAHKLTKEEVKNLEQQLEIAKKEFGENSEEVNRLEKELAETQKQAVEFGQEYEKSISKLEQAKNTLSKVGDKMQSAGKTMSTHVTAPMAAAAGGAIKIASDFESAFAGVKKTVDEVVDSNGKVIVSYDDLEKGIRDMAKRIPASVEEISAVAEAAGQLGIKTEKVLEFTETMIAMGESTNLSSEEAATSIARFANITGMKQTEFDRFGATIVDLGNNFATTEKEIVEMSLRLAGAGKQIGLSEAEIAGLATGLSSVGVEAEAGGSAFSRLMAQMQLSVEKGLDARAELEQYLSQFGFSVADLTGALSGNKEMMAQIEEATGKSKKEFKEWEKDVIESEKSLYNFSNVAGMTNEQFVEMFKSDPAGALQKFIAGLGDAEANGKSATAVLDEMGITEIRLKDALLRASGAQEVFNETQRVGTKAWEENTALNEEVQKRYETFASKMNVVKNKLKDVMIDIGVPLGDALLSALDALEPVFSVVADLAKSFSEANPHVQRFIIAIAGIIAAIGPVLFVLGTVASSISKIITAVQLIQKIGLIGKIGAIFGPLKAVGVAIGGVISSIGAVPIAIGAVLIGIGVLIYKYWDEIKTFFIGIGEWFSELWDSLKEVFLGFWEGLSEDTKGAIELFITAITLPFRGLIETIKLIIDLIRAGIEGGWDGIKEMTAQKWEGIKDFFVEIWEGIKGVFSSVFGPIAEAISSGFNAVKETIVNIWTGIKDFFVEIWNVIAEAFKTIFGPVIDIMVAIFGPILESVKSFLGMIKEAIELILKAIFTIISAILEKIWLFLKDKFIAIFEFIKNIWNQIKDFFKAVWDAIYQLFSNILNAIFTFLSNRFNEISNLVKNVWNSIKSVFETILNAIKSVFETIWDAIYSVLSSIFERIKNTVSSVFESIKNIIGNVLSTIQDYFSSKFENAYQTTKTIFSNIKNAITRPIESARDTIRGAIDSIQGFFRNIKLPHFSLRKKTVSFLDREITIPSGFDISWHAKGGIFTKPTILGNHGFGEAGKEAIVPLENAQHMRPFAEAVAQYLDSGANSGNTVVYINMDNTIKETADVDKIFNYVDKKLNRQGFELNYRRGGTIA